MISMISRRLRLYRALRGYGVSRVAAVRFIFRLSKG
jgi:hypothetical protein